MEEMYQIDGKLGYESLGETTILMLFVSWKRKHYENIIQRILVQKPTKYIPHPSPQI